MSGKQSAKVLLRISQLSEAERAAASRSSGDRPSSASGRAQSRSNCFYEKSSDRLSLQAYGKSAADGFVLIRKCGGQLELTGAGRPQQREVFLYDGGTFVPFDEPAPQPPPPAPPQPQDFVQDALSQLNLPAPQINLGPDPDGAVVNLPMWFWIGGQAQYQATAGLAGGPGVTVTARLATVTWDFGEPVDKPGTSGNQQHATATCTGPGTPAPSAAELNRTPVEQWKPACGHTFRWKSTPERTHGTGTWPVTATVNWNVTWTSTDGTVSGTVQVPPTQNTTTVQVLEYRTRLVNDPDAPTGQAGPEQRQPTTPGG